MTINCLPAIAAQSGLSLRYVGEYALAYGGTNTATATVPALDLGPASPDKQIIIGLGTEVNTFSSITINGVESSYVCINGGFVHLRSAPYTGSGPFNIVATAGATSTENGGVLVWEAVGAAPIHECLRSSTYSGGASSFPLRSPKDSLALGVYHHATDTTAATWTGITEVFDADVGDFRLSAAIDTVPQVAMGNRAITLSSRTSGHLLAVHPPGLVGIRGGFVGANSATGSGSTATFTSLMNFNNAGNPELVIALAFEANVTCTGVTFNGNAMTSRGSVVNATPNPDIVIHFFSISLTNGSASGSIVATFSGSVAAVAINLTKWLLYGVGSYGTLATNQGNSTGGTASPTINAGGAVLASGITSTQVGVTLSGLTNQHADFAIGGNAEYGSTDLINDVAGTKNVTLTTTTQNWALAALPVNP